MSIVKYLLKKKRIIKRRERGGVTEFEVAAGEGVGGVPDGRAAAAEEDRSALQEKNNQRHPRHQRGVSVVVVVFHFFFFFFD